MALAEGKLAVVGEGMRICSRADDHLMRLEFALKNCKVDFDQESLRIARMYLDKLYADLSLKPLAD